MKPVLVFDVNETLLDMTPLRRAVNNLMQNSRGFPVWFSMLLHHSLVANDTGSYHDFAAIAQATLQMTAHQFGIHTDEVSRKQALTAIQQLPAFPDVKPGLQLLQEAGFTLATLTNSPPQTLAAQMEYAGLSGTFDIMMSIDAVQKYKPAPGTYRYAAATLHTNPNGMIMIAAHGWDIAGAMAAGMQAAFIEREHQSLYPLAAKPQWTGKDLVHIADQLIAMYP